MRARIGIRTSIGLTLLALALTLSGCYQHEQPVSVTVDRPFTITNQVMDDGQIAWFVEAPNGIVAEFLPDNTSLHFEIDSSMTVWHDPTNAHVLKTMLEIPGSDDAPGYYVRDINADGVPDLRIRKMFQPESKKEAFIKGQWCPLKTVGEDSYATVGGRDVRVKFDGNGYSEVAQ